MTSVLPEPDRDLAIYVLAELDAHVSALGRLRDRLRKGCSIGAGERRILALQSVTLAGGYAAAVGAALAGHDDTRADADDTSYVLAAPS